MNINLNTSINRSPVKPANKPIKKLSLGAAANYGRDESQSPVPSFQHQQQSEDLLNDDFNPRASEIDGNAVNQEFGDFSAAFGGNNVQPSPKHDDFADFSSAFSNTAQNDFMVPPHNPTPVVPTLEKSSSLLSNSGPNLFGSMTSSQSAPMFPIDHGFAAPPPVQMPSSGSGDLLGDLSGFSSLNLNSQMTTPNGNSSLLMGQQSSLLDGPMGGNYLYLFTLILRV